MKLYPPFRYIHYNFPCIILTNTLTRQRFLSFIIPFSFLFIRIYFHQSPIQSVYCSLVGSLAFNSYQSINNKRNSIRNRISSPSISRHFSFHLIHLSRLLYLFTAFCSAPTHTYAHKVDSIYMFLLLLLLLTFP